MGINRVYHAMVLTAAKLVLNVDAEAGNRIASAYAQPTLWGWLESRERQDWPTLVRGGIAYGNEEMMAGCEQRGLAYLFKLRQTQRVGQMIGKLARQGDNAEWRNAGQGWEGVEQEWQLQGWTVARRVIVRRRKLDGPPQAEPDPAQPSLPGLMLEHKGGEWYEHAVLVTNWAERELLAVAQMYRDRAGAENLFDELKNQWGWTGFSTQDIKRSQLTGIVKYTERILSASGTAAYRIPDILDHANKVIGDVKNFSSKLSMSNQLRDFISYAKGNGYIVVLRVADPSKVSKPLRKQIEELGGRIEQIAWEFV
ncbi:MAG: putative toxin [Acidobacteriota bacterium]